MDPSLFERFRTIAYEQAGIELRDGKESLVSARVAKRLRALGLENEAQYVARLEAGDDPEELVQFLDVISTNFTSFFREPEHFREVRSAVARWLSQGQKRFRFWSAASSSGEEPYTLAMTLADAFQGVNVDWRILATDISTRVLALAKAGRYTEQQVQTVPTELASRYLRSIGEGQVEVSRELAAKIVFARLNLSQPPFPMGGPLDVVLCRNVMIYFDTPVRQRLVSEIERLLRPGGLLMIGHSETLNGLRTGLSIVRPSVYRKSE